MTSTSCKQLAEEVLASAVAGNPPGELPRALVEEPCGQALFGTLVEGLADRFEPALAAVYARLFAQAVAFSIAGTSAEALVERYDRVRRVRALTAEPRQVFVLSRVTLGADVAVTSVLLSAAKLRFPHAEIVFAGPRKNYELFARDPRIRHAELAYRRGSLRERLAAWTELKAIVDTEDAAVLDPDSRLSQLGIMPAGREERYHLFESRAYGGESARSLPELASAWAEETLGVAGASPYVALDAPPERAPYIAVSLGVGENPAKRLEDPFEEELLKLLGERGLPLVIDKGAGGEEAARVVRAVERSRVRADFWDGSFAGFASIVAGAALYVGYDSAGQHIAAASRVPLVSIFAGFPAPRMYDRWRPTGPHAKVIRVDRPDVVETLAKVKELMGHGWTRIHTD